MTGRRAVLRVPATTLTEVSAALSSGADEVVVDLSQGVAPADKPVARQTMAGLGARAAGLLAVRVNALGTEWFSEDVLAAACNPNVDSIVVPRVESAESLARVCNLVERLEVATHRHRKLRVQAVIESPSGLLNASDIARVDRRVESLILGYSDLAASLGRHPDSRWTFAQDALVVAARAGGVDAVDGPPRLANDDCAEASALEAERLGFDGKWVLEPAHVGPVTVAFTPSSESVAEARELVDAFDAATAAGFEFAQWRGRVLDHAAAAQARRTLTRATTSLPV